MSIHECVPECRRIPGLALAHERTRERMRAKRLAKLHGKRPRVRSAYREIRGQS